MIVIKILPTEIVHHIKIGPAIAIVIIPRAAKTIARVVFVETGFLCDVAESSVAVVTHHEIRWTIFGGVVRNRIFVLIGALVIGVEAKINVEPAIAVIVGNGSAGKSSLRQFREVECVGLAPKFAAALVQE